MKSLIFLILIVSILIPFSVNGQTVVPPTKVQKSFNLKYPVAQNVQWIADGKDFKAVFIEDKVNNETKYSSDGIWLSTQRTITTNELPTAVKTSLANGEFSSWNKNAVYVIFLPGMITKYRILISKDGTTKNIILSWDGKLLDDNFSL